MPEENFENWLKLFTLFVKSKEQNDEGVRFYLLLSIGGEAKNFYEYINGDNLAHEEIIMRFRTRVSKMASRAELLIKLENMKKFPNETWPGFVKRYANLARRCEISDLNQVEWVINRLPSNLQTIIATLRLAAVDIGMEGIHSIFSTCQERGIMVEAQSSQNFSFEAIRANQIRKKKK